jgi:hypothetical protein
MRRKVMPHARLAALTLSKHGQGKYRNPNCHEEYAPIESASRRLLRCVQADFHRLAGHLNLKLFLIDPFLPAASPHTKPHPIDTAPKSAILEDLRRRRRGLFFSGAFSSPTTHRSDPLAPRKRSEVSGCHLCGPAGAKAGSGSLWCPHRGGPWDRLRDTAQTYLGMGGTRSWSVAS